MRFDGKKVLVFGSGLSGIGAANLLDRVQAVPIIYDGNESLSENEILNKLDHPQNAVVILGQLPDQLLDTLALAVLSPGVPLDLPEVKQLKAQGIPIWGEIELAYRLGIGRIAAITGTNGKTTTTALTGKIMKDYFDSVFVVGNIGTPYTSAVGSMTDESVTVAEISSFQLETIDKFTPTVSAILNITEDHLNRHHTMEEYIRVKKLIARNQGAGHICVLNYEDPILRDFGKNLHTQVVFFSSRQMLDGGIYLDGDQILWNNDQEEVLVTKTGDLKILGIHNYENVMAAVVIALHMGVPLDSIRKTVQNFTAVEHRIEYVTEKNGVAYYNDSKGTNPDAAIKGIQAMNRPTLLIAGGYDKQSLYGEWLRSFGGKVKYLVLIGQTREKIEKEARENGFSNIILADSLHEAVNVCAGKAVSGDAVLLSPACASWGQFDNYEERGDMFKKYVYEM